MAHEQRAQVLRNQSPPRAAGQKRGPWPVLPEPLPSHLPVGRALRRGFTNICSATRAPRTTAPALWTNRAREERCHVPVTAPSAIASPPLRPQALHSTTLRSLPPLPLFPLSFPRSRPRCGLQVSLPALARVAPAPLGLVRCTDTASVTQTRNSFSDIFAAKQLWSVQH